MDNNSEDGQGSGAFIVDIIRFSSTVNENDEGKIWILIIYYVHNYVARCTSLNSICATGLAR